MRRIYKVVIILAALLLMTTPVFAITNGQPDGDAHPYVGFVHNQYYACSGAAISPTVFVTAAHCFFYSGETVYVSFEEENHTSYITGTWYPDPLWCPGCGNGLLGFDTHDVAVVVLDELVDLPRYAQLPAKGLVDTLPKKTVIDNVGYGVQFDTGGGPRWPEDGFATRYYAPSNLIASNHVNSDEYIKLSSNPAQGKGGTCFGDSGGPNLLGGTDIILAVTSFGADGNCAGVSYSNRIDTYALEFINGFLP